jgi:hypothetical protein
MNSLRVDLIVSEILHLMYGELLQQSQMGQRVDEVLCEPLCRHSAGLRASLVNVWPSHDDTPSPLDFFRGDLLDEEVA